MDSDKRDETNLDSWELDLDATDSENSAGGEERVGVELTQLLSQVVMQNGLPPSSSTCLADSTPCMKVADEHSGNPNNADEVQVSTKPAKRIRKSYYRPVNPFKQIIRIDMRRRLPLMYVNVCNSNSPELYSRFWAQFSSKDCVYKATYPSASKSVFPIAFSSTNFFHLVAHTAYRIATCPDTIVRMHSCYFRRSKEFSGTEIVSFGCGMGTKIFDLDVPLSEIPLELKELTRLRVKAKQAYEVTHWIQSRVMVNENNVIVSMVYECLSSSYVPIPWPSGV